MAEKYELAYHDYKAGMKQKQIAEKYGVTINTVKSWQQRKWKVMDAEQNGSKDAKGASETKKVCTPNTKNRKSMHTKKVTSANGNEAQSSAAEEEMLLDISEFDSGDLTDKQWLFCLEYIKSFNATKAYLKVYRCDYNSAMTNGCRLLRNAKIKKEIKKMKKQRAKSILLDKNDVLQKYMDIAFSDITDYLQFGREEEICYDDDGRPEIDAAGNVKTYMRSFVHLKDSSEVDGTLITEVKQGRDGISFKLADKMKALQVLAEYTELLKPRDVERLRVEMMQMDVLKKQIENEQAQMELENAKLNDQANYKDPFAELSTTELRAALNTLHTQREE